MSAAILGAMIGASVLLVALAYLRAMPGAPAGAGYWTAGYALWVLRLGLYLVGGPLHPQFAVFLAEAMQGISALMLLAGTLCFQGHGNPRFALTHASLAVSLWAAFSSFIVDDFARFMKLLMLAGSAFAIILSFDYLKSAKILKFGETFTLKNKDGTTRTLTVEDIPMDFDTMAACGQPPEDLVQVDLGTTRLRVQSVLPVQDQELQGRPSPPAAPLPDGRTRRMSASRTPFTKRGLSSVPYFSARMMASWIATRSGTSGTYSSSAAPMRSTFRSMTERRSRRQLRSSPSSA